MRFFWLSIFIKAFPTLYCLGGQRYGGAHISWHELFLAGNQGNHQSLVPSMQPYKWPTQKTQNSANYQYFFTKISGVGPWASKINVAQHIWSAGVYSNY